MCEADRRVGGPDIALELGKLAQKHDPDYKHASEIIKAMREDSPRISKEIKINSKLVSTELALEREHRERRREGFPLGKEIAKAIEAADPTGQRAAILAREDIFPK